MSDKAKVSGSIVRAKLALEQALANLDRVPLADPGVSALMAHALNNFLSVSLATIDVLRETLTNPPEDEAWQLDRRPRALGAGDDGRCGAPAGRHHRGAPAAGPGGDAPAARSRGVVPTARRRWAKG